MHSRLKLTALAATAAAVGAAAVPSSSQSEAAGARTLALVGREAASAFLEHGGHASAVGNEFVSAQRLLRQGTVIGRAGGSCQIVVPAPGRNRHTFHCTLTLRLPAGQIALTGLATFGESGPRPMAMAITGGTGSYQDARGQATVEERRGETRYRLELRR